MDRNSRLDMENKLRDQGVREMPPRYELETNSAKHNDLKQIQNKFISQGEFKFDNEIEIGGIRYAISQTSKTGIKEMVFGEANGMIAYGTRFREQAEAEGLAPYIVFLWGNKSNSVVPMSVLGVREAGLTYMDSKDQIEKYKSNGGFVIEDDAKVNISKEKIIGNNVEVIIVNLPGSNPINAKVDTGADVSSIHADEWSVDNGMVSFINEEISQNKITVPVIEKQAIKSSNGDIEYRPVISLNVKVNGIPLSDVMFNLNDRGTMTYSMLVGKNILERGGFMIDPKLNEDAIITEEEMINGIDLDVLQEQIKDFKFDDEDERISDILNYIQNKLA